LCFAQLTIDVDQDNKTVCSNENITNNNTFFTFYIFFINKKKTQKLKNGSSKTNGYVHNQKNNKQHRTYPSLKKNTKKENNRFSQRYKRNFGKSQLLTMSQDIKFVYLFVTINNSKQKKKDFLKCCCKNAYKQKYIETLENNLKELQKLIMQASLETETLQYLPIKNAVIDTSLEREKFGIPVREEPIKFSEMTPHLFQSFCQLIFFFFFVNHSHLCEHTLHRKQSLLERELKQKVLKNSVRFLLISVLLTTVLELLHLISYLNNLLNGKTYFFLLKNNHQRNKSVENVSQTHNNISTVFLLSFTVFLTNTKNIGKND
ncbi:hypothetical protein RFI_30808, partial [Reticulomyxa filosa]